MPFSHRNRNEHSSTPAKSSNCTMSIGKTVYLPHPFRHSMRLRSTWIYRSVRHFVRIIVVIWIRRRMRWFRKYGNFWFLLAVRISNLEIAEIRRRWYQRSSKQFFSILNHFFDRIDARQSKNTKKSGRLITSCVSKWHNEAANWKQLKKLNLPPS